MNYRYGAAREVDFGTLITTTFGNLALIRQQLLAYLAAMVGLAFLLPLVGDEPTGLLNLALYFIGQYWLFHALLKARGQLRTTRYHGLAFVGLALLLILPIIFGIGLFVLPGLFLVARWIAAPAFIVARGDGVIAAASGSWNAVRGSTLKVAGVVVLLVVLVSVIGAFANAMDGSLAAVEAYRTARPGNLIQVNLLPLLLLGLSTATYELLGPEDTTIQEVFG